MIPIAHRALGEEEFAAVREVLASGMIAQGPKVKAFEDAFARDLSRKHGIAVANGTAVLHITSAAQGIKPGDDNLIPPLVFATTGESHRIHVCWTPTCLIRNTSAP